MGTKERTCESRKDKIMEERLQVLREQVKIASAFLQACDEVWQDGYIWYEGDMPGYPDEYEPHDWQQTNEPIYKSWERALDHLASDSKDAAKIGRSLPIADLLARSRNVHKGLV